jgi:hypothetical protein
MTNLRPLIRLAQALRIHQPADRGEPVSATTYDRQNGKEDDDDGSAGGNHGVVGKERRDQ